MTALTNRFLYAGEQLDRVTGQYYQRARHYNPELGRYTQEDPYTGDGLNLNIYTHNNPIKYVDPSGNFVATTIGMFVGGILVELMQLLKGQISKVE